MRINEHGVNDRNGKFDNEVVYMGTRFVFEIELLSDQENDSWFDKTLATLYRDTMRIGGGTRCGYGKMKVVSCLRADLNLTEASDLAAYIKKPSCLSEKWTTFAEWQPSAADVRDDGWITYTLRLQPQDFFLFGSGFGDDDADNTPAVERVVEWGNGKPCFSQQRTLVPASSVKVHWLIARHIITTSRIACSSETKTPVPVTIIQPLLRCSVQQTVTGKVAVLAAI